MAYRTTSWKNTDIGKIPNDWSVVPLSSICDNYTGLTYSPSDVSNSGTLVLRSSNIQNDRLSFLDNVFVKMSIPERAMARNGDLLVCVRNGSPKLIGKSAIVTGDNMAFGAFMTVLRAKNFSAKYLPFIWRSSYIQRQVQITLGATINQITNGDIRKFFVPISQNVEEQQKIAAVLTDLDDLIAELEKLRDKKQAIKIGAMQELLTGKRRLPGFNKPWKKVELGEIAAFEKGKQLNRTAMIISGYPVYNGGITASGYTDDYNTESNTVIISEGGNSCGYVNFITERFWAGGHCYVLSSEITDKNFLYQVLKLQEEQIMALRIGSGLPNIQIKALNCFKLYIPTDKIEQTTIANILSDMDDEISAINDKINKYKQIKAGVADELLSGRIRLIKPQE